MLKMPQTMLIQMRSSRAVLTTPECAVTTCDRTTPSRAATAPARGPDRVTASERARGWAGPTVTPPKPVRVTRGRTPKER